MKGARRRAALARSRVYLIVTPAALASDWATRTQAALETGLVGLVQLRATGLDDVAVPAALAALVAAAAGTDTLVIVNDRVELALEREVDGLHVGMDDAPPDTARRALGPEALIGGSTHDADELHWASGQPLDYVGLGPCFDSRSKTLDRPVQGSALARLAASAPARLPVFLIGGITVATIPALVEEGATRVAVGQGILGASDPAEAARRIADLLPPAPHPAS